MNESNDFNELKRYIDLFERAIKSQDTQNLLKYLKKLPSLEELFLKSYQKRKKEGVYYTTDKLSMFIVSEAILSLLESRNSLKKSDKIQEIHKLNNNQRTELIDILINISIYDPACGSGIFLLNAVKTLFNLVKDLNPNSDTSETKALILKNVYGQDINDFAIKFSILKLFNWYFEDCKTNNTQVILNLKSNLKVGNSLKSPIRLNFDLVIGNPPYGNILSKEEKAIFKKEKIYNDIYCGFLIKALDWSNGVIGLLVPKSFLLRQSYVEFRNEFLLNANILKIFDIGSKMFKNATNEVQVIIYERKIGSFDKDLQIYDYPNLKMITYKNQNVDSLRACYNLECPVGLNSKKLYAYTFRSKCPYCASETIKLNRIRIKVNKQIMSLIEKIDKKGDLNYLNPKDFPKMIRGEEDKGLIELKRILQDNQQGSCTFISARNDFRYYTFKKRKSLNIEEIDEKVLKGRNYEFYIGPKLLIKHNNIFPEAIYTEENVCFTSSIYSLLHNDIIELKYLCAVLNSKLIQFYCTYAINNQKDTTINLNQYMIRHLPIVKNLNQMRLQLAESVDSINSSYKISNDVHSGEVQRYRRRIDELIFELYSLTEEEQELITSNINY